MLKYILYAVFGFVLFGCGSNTEFDPHANVPSGYDINVSRSIELIKEEQGRKYIDHFVAKDNQNIFVLVSSNTYHFSLYNYDIKSVKPKFVNTVVESNEGEIKNIYPLKKHKLLYTVDYHGEANNLYIYDYDKQKEIRYFRIFEGKKVLLNNDETVFTKGSFTIDIHDIYQDELKNSRLYRDDNKEIVVDKIHKMIWLDDSSTMYKVQSRTQAQRTCQTKEGYKWRLPTYKDINKLREVEQKPFISSPFHYINDDARFPSIWLENRFHYYIKAQAFEADTGYDYVYDGYIRCVADIK